MKVLLSLIKTNLNVNFGISALKYRFTKEKKRLWEPILLLLSVLIGLGSITGLYSLLLMGVFMAGNTLGQPEIVLTIAFVASQLIILIFGIFYIISSFYFSKDMNILIPLPIKPSQLIASKFVTILVNEYLVALPLLLPAIIIYGTSIKVNIVYWFKGVILILAAPVLPLVIASIFIIILMRFINVRKSKDLLMILGSLIGVLAGLAINIFAQKIPENGGEEFIANMVQSQEGIIRAISEKFPPSLWATFGLAKPGLEGLGYFVLFIGLSILLFAVLMWLGNLVFYKGLLSGQEVHRKNKTISAKQLKAQSAKSSSPVVALFKKEWKLFMRTPIYVMNGLAGVIIAPLFMLIPLFTQEKEMAKLISQLKNPELGFAVTLGTLAIALFMSCLNIVACTAISREGSLFWVSKIIPVPPRDQVLAKLIHSTVLSLMGVFVIIAIVQFLVGLSALRILALIILGVLGSFMLNAMSLIIDVLRPKLEWNDPQEAIKQNMNALFSMLLSLISMALFTGIVVVLILVKAPEWLTYLILAIAMGLIAIVSLYLLFALAGRQYKRIEL